MTKQIGNSTINYLNLTEGKHLLQFKDDKKDIMFLAQKISQYLWVDDLICAESEILIYAEKINWNELQQLKLNIIKTKKQIRLPIYLNEHQITSDILAQKKIEYDEFKTKLINTKYRLSMRGFIPGFVYLRGLPPSLMTPRKNKASLTPKGSVAIGNQYLGIYPKTTPGAWNVIGKCPVDLFSLQLQHTNYIQPEHEILVELLDDISYDALLRAHLSLAEYNSYD